MSPFHDTSMSRSSSSVASATCRLLRSAWVRISVLPPFDGRRRSPASSSRRESPPAASRGAGAPTRPCCRRALVICSLRRNCQMTLPSKSRWIEFERFLVRRTRAARSHDDAARQHARRTARGVVVAVPALDDVAVHVDDEHGLRPQRRQHRIAVPCALRLIDRRARGIDRLRPRRGERGQEESRTGAAKSSHTPAECGPQSTFSQPRSLSSRQRRVL